MSQSRSFTTPALVLKRVNTGEADRVVTLLTPSQGKILCVAKGSRKMQSSKRAFLEPGNLITAYLIKTKSMPLLTQAMLLEDHAHCKTSLTSMRQLSQILEIADRLFQEQVEEPELYQTTLDILYDLNHSEPKLGHVKQKLTHLISQFGFVDMPATDLKQGLLELVAQITEKPMRSWEYLSVR